MSGAIFSTEDIVEVNQKEIEHLKDQARSFTGPAFSFMLTPLG